MSLERVFTILRETFAAPGRASYIVGTARGDVVVRQGESYRDLDLSGVNLAGADLHATVFEGGRFVGTDFRGANLAGASLRSADLSAAKFEGADMSRATISDVYFDVPPTGINLPVTFPN